MHSRVTRVIHRFNYGRHQHATRNEREKKPNSTGWVLFLLMSFDLFIWWENGLPTASTAVIPGSSWLEILQFNEQSRQLYPVDQYFALFWKIETMHYNTHGWYLLTNVFSQSYQSAILYHPLLEVEKRQKDCCQLTGILLAMCAYIAKKYTITNQIESLFECYSECHYHGIACCTRLHKCKIINTTISMHGIIVVWGYLWLKCC